MTNCPQKPFGCDCGPGECQSLAVRIENHRRRYDQAALDYQNAVFRVLCALVVTACLAGLLVLAAVSAEQQFKKQDQRQQEIARHDR